jgi:hypothetical protein
MGFAPIQRRLNKSTSKHSIREMKDSLLQSSFSENFTSSVCYRTLAKVYCLAYWYFISDYDDIFGEIDI